MPSVECRLAIKPPHCRRRSSSIVTLFYTNANDQRVPERSACCTICTAGPRGPRGHQLARKSLLRFYLFTLRSSGSVLHKQPQSSFHSYVYFGSLNATFSRAIPFHQLYSPRNFFFFFFISVSLVAQFLFVLIWCHLICITMRSASRIRSDLLPLLRKLRRGVEETQVGGD